jgi:membrane protein implicated in regulation of membrane protease activity
MEEAVMAQSRPARAHVGTWIVIAVLLAAALIGTLWVPFYNHTAPALWGFPFFYWYQLMWVPIVAILSAVAYLLSKVAQRGNAAASAQPRDAGQGEAS